MSPEISARGTTRSIHQLLHTLSYGDAISGEVIALQRCLHSLGYDSEIFALNVHPKLKGKAQKALEIPTYCDEIVFHYSLGSPLNAQFKALDGVKRTVVYHNITPPECFDGVNPRVARDIRAGVAELREICAISDHIWADSEFNAEEIRRLGFKAEVLELPIDPERWVGVANPGFVGMLDGMPGPHLLHVGRLAPNKCVEDIIKIFYFVKQFAHKDAVLWLAGIDTDTELYSFSLKRLAASLGLSESVRFLGCRSDDELRALYERSHVYLCMSEHEGFCLPVVEAMHFGLPVISFASSALPATIGAGGILVHEKRHHEIAEIVNKIVADVPFRESLIAAGKARVTELSYGRFTKRVEELYASRS